MPVRPVLVTGAHARTLVSSIGPGWHEGIVGDPSGGCALTSVDATRAPTGGLGVFLHGIERLQIAPPAGTGGTRWEDVPMRTLRTEDADCARE